MSLIDFATFSARRTGFAGGIALIVVVLAAAFAPTSASAQAGLVSMELNKLEQRDDACLAFLVIENTTPTAFDSFSLDLVAFDTDGVIANRLAVEMGPLRSGKTVVKAFGVEGVPCDGIGRLLLNDVVRCSDDGGERGDCLDIVSTSTRSAAEFTD